MGVRGRGSNGNVFCDKSEVRIVIKQVEKKLGYNLLGKIFLSFGEIFRYITLNVVCEYKKLTCHFHVVAK